MPTYLYCVLAPPEPDGLVESLTGLADAPVRSLVARALGPIEAWVSTVDEASLQARGRALAAQALLHNEVVNAALRSGRTPAPARYGSRFGDDAACVADLARRSAELLAILGHVADAVEMSVLLVPSDAHETPIVRPASAEDAPGRRYLESVRIRARENDRLRIAGATEADRIREALDEFVRDEARNFAVSGVMSIAHLVPRTTIEGYRAALAALSPSSEFRLVIGNMRAPYSFAGAK